jgi:hypothetical protein
MKRRLRILLISSIHMYDNYTYNLFTIILYLLVWIIEIYERKKGDKN